MAKINILFNDKEYQVDESALSTTSDALKSHLSTIMNGSGAIINLGGTAYNIDSTKLQTATNDFISHLRTIAGNGHKVVVGGIEYYVDSNNVKNAFSELHANFAKLAGIDTVEDLQNKYEFIYFSTLNDAVNAVNNGTAAESGIENKENAVAGIYIDENNVPNVVLLQDSTEEKMTITTDMTINLGGNILTGTASPVIAVSTGDVYIDGRLNGSEIRVVVGDGVSARLVSINTGCTVTLDGGLYYNEGTNTTSAAIICKGTVIAQNIKLRNKAVNTSRLDGFSMSGGSKAVITNCDILSEVTDGKSYGIYVGQNCDITATNSSIKAYANYNHNGSSYTSSSLGIYHSKNSVLNLNNCYVTGTVAGIQTYGTVYVNGGTYEGYGHGGFYFVGNSTTSYMRNAIIRESAMPEGYTNNNGTNHVGFYAGTGSNNSIYVDNCIIESEGDAIVLKGSSGDSLYISNSHIGEGKKIRIDSTAQKLYIGVGNNFTADDTTLPDAVVQTNEVYIYSN